MRQQEKPKIKGYLYVADEDNLLFRDVKIGDSVVKPDREPPYFVVDHFLHKVLVTKWPGKLYKAEIINQAAEKDINRGLVKDIWYTRTLGVKILEEVPIENIFGNNGSKIKQVVDIARYITEEQANRLAEISLEYNRELYSKVWEKWISITDKEYASLAKDHQCTLEAHPKNQKHESPIRKGLSITWTQLYHRARELEGDLAVYTDEEGDVCLVPKWSNAGEHLLNAGISYESNNLLTDAEKEQLRSPVKEVFNL